MTDRAETTPKSSLGQHRGAVDVGSGRRSRRLLARWIVAVFAGLLCVGLLLLAVVSVERSELRLLANDGERQLDLHAAQLAGRLARFDYLPQVLATDARLVELLLAPDNAARLAELNRALEEIAAISGAADVYVMNADGLTIAASNWQSQRTFIGRFFHYRPYFQQAMAGQPGRYFALGSTSGLRGYYFAHPIRDGGDVLGAVVVKVDMSNAEAHLAHLGQEVLVTDPDGVVFISTRREWRFRTLTPLSDKERRRLRESLRYPGVDFAPLPIRISTNTGPTQVWTAPRKRASDAPTNGTPKPEGSVQFVRYLAQQLPMPDAGWTMHLLTPMSLLHPRVLAVVAVAGALCLTLFSLALGLWQRHERQQERALFDQQASEALRRAHDELEHRVEQRTADLLRSNERLSREIDERRRTEAELRQTQGELVQAAKLATLGQLSAGINHELNQPMAAIRSYADNGRALLAKGRFDEVGWNLQQVSELIGRMGRIAGQLKIFARKSTGRVGPVAVDSVIDTALAVVAPRIRRTGAELDVMRPAPALRLRGDENLVQQVLVNLLGNALQAIDGQPRRLVRVSARTTDDSERPEVVLAVEDTGPGIAGEHLERIFDAFFTTKDGSEGLGLGLTISKRIIEDLDGSLEAGPSALGGARFTIRLPAD
jgi:two-component system C4-dicarboxylate transport sensor histidine kinase DctB